MDQFDRSRFYREHDHVIRDHARRSRQGPRGPLGTLDRDRRDRPLLAAALIVAVVTLLILVLAQVASDRQAAAPAVVDEAVASRMPDDAWDTLVRPPGWISAGLVADVPPEPE